MNKYRADWYEVLILNKLTGVKFYLQAFYDRPREQGGDDIMFDQLFAGWLLPEGVGIPKEADPHKSYEIISLRSTGDYLEMDLDEEGNETAMIEHYPYIDSLPPTPEGYDKHVRLA